MNDDMTPVAGWSDISPARHRTLASIDRLRLVIDGPGQLATSRATIGRWLGSRLSDAATIDVQLACGEAVANALVHGAPPVDVELTFDAPTGELQVQVHDGGCWLDTGGRAGGGRGLPLMRSLMSSVDVRTGAGTTITLCRLPERGVAAAPDRLERQRRRPRGVT